MTTKIYISGRFSQRILLRPIRDEIVLLGYEVISTWLDEPYGEESFITIPSHKKYALRDLIQLAQANLVLLDTLSALAYNGGGGREFEAGFVLAQGPHQIIWRIGPPRNPFHYLVDESFVDWRTCLKQLKKTKKSVQ